MAVRIVLGCYAITGTTIITSNNINYQPDTRIMRTYWNLLKVDTPHGVTAATTVFVLAPLFVPVGVLTLPMLYGMECIKNLHD